MAFLGDFEAVEVEGGAVNDRGSAARGFDSRVNHGMHRGSVRMAYPLNGNGPAWKELMSDAVRSGRGCRSGSAESRYFK